MLRYAPLHHLSHDLNRSLCSCCVAHVAADALLNVTHPFVCGCASLQGGLTLAAPQTVRVKLTLQGLRSRGLVYLDEVAVSCLHVHCQA
jgi:hypothetical protein